MCVLAAVPACTSSTLLVSEAWLHSTAFLQHMGAQRALKGEPSLRLKRRTISARGCLCSYPYPTTTIRLAYVLLLETGNPSVLGYEYVLVESRAVPFDVETCLHASN